MASSESSTKQFKDENMAPSSHENTSHLERLRGTDDSVNDQPALPVYHRKFASPSPLGLISFATGEIPLNKR